MDQPQWQRSKTLLPSNDFEAARSQLSPTAIAIGNYLYCVWVDSTSPQLWYSGLNLRPDNDHWGLKMPICLPGSTTNEQASATPALATIAGDIHLVYPDLNQNLIHWQFDTGNQVWGRRQGVVAKTSDPPSIAVFGGKLFCVYRATATDDTDGMLFITYWTSATGWTSPTMFKTTNRSFGQFALFELGGRLQLLVAIGSQVSNKTMLLAYRYSYDVNSGNWTLLDIPSMPSVASQSGVSVTCVYNMAFTASLADFAKRTVSVTQYDLIRNQWISDSVGEFTSTSTPAVATGNNQLYCIWSDNQDGNRLKWAVRFALREIPSLNQWMSALPENIPISAVTLPGTHDAAAISNIPFTGCHEKSIMAQLNAGIRYFDIRAGFAMTLPFSSPSQELVAYHNIIPLRDPSGWGWSALTIASILQDCYTFLNTNGQECIVIQMKQDYGAGDPNEVARFAQAVKTLTDAMPARWRLDSTVPQLSDLRGKIQLLRRFPLAPTMENIGIDLSQGWPNNPDTAFIIAGTGFAVSIQDHYGFGSSRQVAAKKFQLVMDQLDKARLDRNLKNWYINFSSGVAVASFYQSWNVANGCLVLDTQDNDPDIPTVVYEEGVNKLLANFFNDHAGTNRYGTIVMDYPHNPEELILAIIRSNFAGATQMN